MKARSASIITSPGLSFDKNIDPLAGRTFTETLGNLVSSGLSAVADKVCAVIIFATKAAVDAAVAAGTQAVHSVHLLATDAGTKSGIANLFTSTMPANDGIAVIEPTSVTSQRSKIWGMNGFQSVTSDTNGQPSDAMPAALFRDVVRPQPSSFTVAQIIQMIGDEIESLRAASAPEITGTVMVVVSQNAGAIIVAAGVSNPSAATVATAIGASEIAHINVAANDVPVAATGANFGE